MTKLNPSATDTEIRSLDPIGGGSHIAMAIFMKALIDWLQSNQSFEIVQAYISLFLKVSLFEVLQHDVRIVWVGQCRVR